MILLSIEEGLFAWMADHMPHVLIALILLIICCWLTWKISKLHQRFSKTESQCNDIRDKYVPDLHKKITGMDGKLNSVLTTVIKISTHLITAQGLAANIFEAKSPIELTEIGNKLLVDIGGKKYIDDNQASLIAEIESKKPKSGLDVQNYSNIILTEKTSDDGFTHIKNYIFQNPVYLIDGNKDKTLNVDLGMVTQIMGIFLRNKYFEKYPDLKKDL